VFTDEQKSLARELLRAHESHVERHYADTLFELEMRLGLDDEQVYKLIEEVQ
jgi:hypothetical protein